MKKELSEEIKNFKIEKVSATPKTKKIEKIETKMNETLQINETTFEIAKENGKWRAALMGIVMDGEWDTAEAAKDKIRETFDPMLGQIMHIIAFNVAKNLTEIQEEIKKYKN